MAPTPTEPHAIPPLHLQVLDLSHPGVSRFFAYTSDPHSLLSKSCQTVLSTLYPPALASTSKSKDSAPPGPPPIRSVTLFLRSFDGVAHTCGSNLDEQHKEFHLSTSYVAGVSGESAGIKQEIEGVVVHELVHVFQWDGSGTCPGGIIEGIADWVRLGAGLGPPHWSKGGERWDQGYEATAYFLDYLSTRLKLPLLVPTLNLALRSRTWEEGGLLKELLGGRDVDELWKEYKRGLDDQAQGGPAVAVPTHGAGYAVGY